MTALRARARGKGVANAGKKERRARSVIYLAADHVVGEGEGGGVLTCCLP